MVRSLEAVGLTKTYGRSAAPVLDHVAFRFEGSGAVGYLGPNGAGKSTTLKLFVGLIRPTSGTARINGIDPIEDRQAALWDVGAVIESPQPYKSETVFDALNRVGLLRGLDPEGIDDAIDQCNQELGLPPLGQRCGTLSTGLRQRVALAAARMGNPRILLLDEPTDGMDPTMRAQVRRHLRELRQDHLILMSSHLMSDVMEVCDRVVFIDGGKILLQDTAEAVVDRGNARLLEVEFVQPVAPSAWKDLGSIVEELTPLSGRRFHVRFDGTEATRQRILEGAQRLGTVHSFANAVPSLEEAYSRIVGPGR